MLSVLNREEAVALIREKTAGIVPEKEKVNISNALGRILAEDIVSGEDIPSFDRATVDGYAVKAADTFGAGDSIPSQLETAGEILMGETADFILGKGQCAKISTGGMLPEGADAAVMVEHKTPTVSASYINQPRRMKISRAKAMISPRAKLCLMKAQGYAPHISERLPLSEKKRSVYIKNR